LIKVNARADASGVRRVVIAATAGVADTSEKGGGADITEPKFRAIAGNCSQHRIDFSTRFNKSLIHVG